MLQDSEIGESIAFIESLLFVPKGGITSSFKVVFFKHKTGKWPG